MNVDVNCAGASCWRLWRHSWLFLCAVFLVGAAVSAQRQGDGPSKKLDLNTATAEELDTLPEVGPKLAKAIVAFREKSGPFQRVEDLLAVPGISKRRLEKLRPHVYVEGAADRRPKANP
jgi:competence ComEA-like helix-hairpin-helix protein